VRIARVLQIGGERARRRFGLRDAGEADVVYIRAQVGAARGEIRCRQ